MQLKVWISVQKTTKMLYNPQDKVVQKDADHKCPHASSAEGDTKRQNN